MLLTQNNILRNIETILLIKSIKALKNTPGMNFEAYSERLATLHEFCSPTKIKSITQKPFQIINKSMKMKSVNKTQFAGLYDKRYYFYDRIVSLPFGHFLLEKVRKEKENTTQSYILRLKKTCINF